MTDFNKDIKPYTAKDFERYYAGQMTAGEMHQLEKSALDDPFLQDALEGYQFTRQGAADVAALKEQVDQRIKKSKVVSIGRKDSTRGFWKVAAMLLLTAGMAWLIYTVALNTRSKDIAVMEKPLEIAPAATEPAGDTSAASTETKAGDDVNNTTAIVSSPKVNQKPNRDQNEVSGKSNNNAAAPSVSSPSAGRQVQPHILTQQEAAAPDVALQTNDSSGVIGYGTTRREQRNKDSYSLSKRAKSNDLEEAIKEQPPANASYPKHPIRFEEAFPAKGVANYHEYVAQHIQVPLNEKNESASGEVTLSFNVNSKGEPIHIKVEKSLCKPCDAEAVRLLREGPGWKLNKNSKKGKFSIFF